MKAAPIVSSMLAALALCGCASNQADASAREWQRAECNNVIDREDRERCLKRADDYYGSRSREAEKPAVKR